MLDWKLFADGAHLADLVAFAAVVEHGSFTAAARVLKRDATVVSRRVRALEARLGVRLLESSTRHVAATEAGNVLFSRVRSRLDQLAEAESEAVALASDEPRGTLKLALPTTFGRMWIAPELPAFLAQYPKVSIEASFSNRFVDMITEGFDVAVRLGVLEDSGLVARRIGERHRLLCASPAYLEAHGTPRHPRELAAHRCLAFSGFTTHPEWHLVKGSRHETVRISGPMVSDDAEALVSAALAGLGVMLTTDWLVGRDVAEGRLVHVFPGWTMSDRGGIHVVMRSNRFVPSKTRAFIDWVSALFAPTPPWRIKKSIAATGAGAFGARTR